MKNFNKIYRISYTSDLISDLEYENLDRIYNFLKYYGLSKCVDHVFIQQYSNMIKRPFSTVTINFFQNSRCIDFKCGLTKSFATRVKYPHERFTLEYVLEKNDRREMLAKYSQC